MNRTLEQLNLERKKMIRKKGAIWERLEIIRNMQETMEAEQMGQATKF